MQRIMKLFKQNRRGSAIIEYVVILAFIAGIGLSFTDGSMSGSIGNIIKKVSGLFGERSSNMLVDGSKIFNTFYNGGSSNNDILYEWFDGHFRYSIQSANSDGKGALIPVEPNTTYQIVVDLSKLPEGLSARDIRACAFLWENPSNKATMDTGDMAFSGVNLTYGKTDVFTVDKANNTATFTFTTNENQKGFGMNIVIDKNKVTESIKTEVKNNYTDLIKLEKK